MGVAVVGDHDAGLERDEVVPAVPLLALRLVHVTAGLDRPQRADAERVGDHVEERPRLLRDLDAAAVGGTQRERVDPVDDVGEDRRAVAIGEREHGVEVHRRAQLRQSRHDHALRRPVAEQDVGDLADRLARGALPHTDQHDPAPDRHHVAALEGRESPVPLGVAPPHVHAGVGEPGMETVDRLHQQRLVAPGGPEQRVECHATVDPRRRVARVQRVRQRRHQVLADVGGLPRERQVPGAELLRQIDRGQPADHEAGQLAVVELLQERARLVDEAEPDLVRDDLAVEQPRLRLGETERLGQQVVQLEHFDAPLLHPDDELGVVALRVLHPHHIVEQQIVPIRRGEAIVSEPGGAHEHRAQPAHLGVDPVGAGTGGVRVNHVAWLLVLGS